jgi:hypothetical protein
MLTYIYCRKMKRRTLQVHSLLSAILFISVPAVDALPRWLNPLSREPHTIDSQQQYSVYESFASGGYSYGGYGPQPALRTNSDTDGQSISITRGACKPLSNI